VSEAVIAEAIQQAHVETQKVLAGIEEFVKKAWTRELAVPEEESS